MKVKVTGMTTWQDTPIGGTLRVYPEGRYEDGQGNAVPGRYDFALNVAEREWRDERNTAADAYIVVAGPGDAQGIEAVFDEVFLYPGNVQVRQIYRRLLVASDLAATEYDYTDPQHVLAYVGDEPLPIKAARKLVADFDGVLETAQQAAAEAAALLAERRLPTNPRYAYAITDKVGDVAFGVTPNGDVVIGTTRSVNTTGPYVGGWTDRTGQLAAGVDRNGHWHVGRTWTMPAPAGISSATADRYGYLMDARDTLGRPILPPAPTIWQEGDQIYSLVDGVQYQVTHGPGNSGPVLDPDHRYVTYTSTRSGTARPMRGEVRGLGEVTLTDWGNPARLNHLYVTGQSLSLGVRSTPPRSSVQVYGHVKLSDGTRSRGGNAVTLVPLIEDQITNNFFDSSPIGETALSAVANRVGRDLERRGLGTPHRILGSVSGRGGTPIGGIKKGSDIYANGLAQWDAGRRLAGAMWRLSALLMVHGENDDLANNLTYAADLWQLLTDYQADLEARVPGHAPVPMLLRQIACWGAYSNRIRPVSPLQMLQASEDHPDRIYLVGPSYWNPGYSNDDIHLTAQGTFYDAEKFGQAYQVVLEGKPWVPLKPIGISITGRTILVRYHVPHPPLVLDTALVTNPGDYGIEVLAPNASPLALAGVEVTGPETVRITLAADPPAGTLRVIHAGAATPGVGAGPTKGPRCCLRDSDPLTSVLDGYPLYNWATVSDRPVPYTGGN